MRLAANTTIEDIRLGPNFWLGEFTRSELAERHGIDNTPRRAEIECLRYLVRNVLQPLRDYYGRFVSISSGYRCPELNELAGGVDDSGHALACAADFQVVGVPHLQVARRIAAGCEFHELGLEYLRGKRWVHLYVRPWEAIAVRELWTCEDVTRGRKWTHMGVLLDYGQEREAHDQEGVAGAGEGRQLDRRRSSSGAEEGDTRRCSELSRPGCTGC